MEERVYIPYSLQPVPKVYRIYYEINMCFPDPQIHFWVPMLYIATLLQHYA